MTPGIALLIVGALALISGWKNQPLTAVFDGSGEKSPGGSPGDYGGSGAVDYGQAAGTDATGGVSTGVVPGVGHVDTPGSSAAAAAVTAAPGTRIFDGKPVANWIIPQLNWARNHGWQGQVTSGWRDPRAKVTPSPGMPVAAQGQSNHSKTVYPGGAVDVTAADQLEAILASYPNPLKLRRGTAIGDPIHFSGTGR